MNKLSFLLIVLAVLIFGCIPQNDISTPRSQQSTQVILQSVSPTSKPSTATLHPPIATITPTFIPIQIHPSSLANGIEVIIFIPSETTNARIPDIHIWKDGYAVWVDFDSIHRMIHVYETTLSPAAMLHVQEVIVRSGFWEFDGTGLVGSDAGDAFPNIWINQSGKQKHTVMLKQNQKHAIVLAPKFNSMISSLKEILDASPRKAEYFPKQAYLWAQEETGPIWKKVALDAGFQWPDDELSFDFSQTTQRVLVDGKILSIVWQAIEEKHFWVISHGLPYYFQLEIPGVTCHEISTSECQTDMAGSP